MDLNQDEFREIAQSSAAILPQDTQILIFSIEESPDGCQSDTLCALGPPLTSTIEAKIKGTISRNLATTTLTSQDDLPSENPEEEAGLALDILDSEGVVAVEPIPSSIVEAGTSCVSPSTGTRSEDSPSALIATPFLDNLGLKFNRRYEAIYCCACQQYVPLPDLHGHLTAGWKYYVSETERSTPHSPPMSAIQKNIAIKTREDLETHSDLTGVTRVTGFIGKAAAAWKAWALPHPDEVGPVEGLPSYSGFQCNGCPVGHLTREELLKHTGHQDATHTIREGPVQSFSRRKNFIQWFHVRTPEPKTSESLDLGRIKAQLLAGTIDLQGFKP
ncbi:hypothetical protein B0H14DRAFT_3888288 [Mycena olivaceomarginata]|nr:hypothetical protein B0H14DRAFT_3888288 [Mycena olivaceomarginata]